MQCHKNLWLHVHRKDLEAPPDAATKLQFAEGNEVGELARKHFGSGDLVDTPHWEYEKAHAATQELIKSGAKTIFEAAFLAGELYARADILSHDKDGWHMIEVKKASQVKDYYVEDTAIQAHIVELTGLKLKSISIMHINNKVVYPDINELFVTHDITEDVRERQKELGDKLALFKKIVKVKSEPKVDIGQHCDSPFACPFKAHCWRGVPKQSVFTLPGLHAKKKWQLFHEGKSAIENLDPKKFKDTIKRAIEVTQTNKVFVDAKSIAGALKKWQWPLYFFDFETINPAIPRYEGTAPYAMIPFQFSSHVW
jgi:predicted RecB family nuclease